MSATNLTVDQALAELASWDGAVTANRLADLVSRTSVQQVDAFALDDSYVTIL